MPFRIPRHYATLTTSSWDPSRDELVGYVRWLTNELTCAQVALELITPKNPPDSTVNTFAQSGGKARAAKLTPEQRKEQAKKAAAQRWKKKPAEEVTTPIPVDPVPQGE